MILGCQPSSKKQTENLNLMDKKTPDSIIIEECSPSPEISSLIDSLIQNQKRCIDYDSSLIWTITMKKNNSGIEDFEITMIPGLQVYSYGEIKPVLGYFYLKNNLVIAKEINGPSSLLARRDIFKKFRFYNYELFSLRDYSVWYYKYNYLKDEIKLSEAFELRCI